MIIEFNKVDTTDKTKSTATVIFDEENKVSVNYWHSVSYSIGEDLENFIVGLALYESGKKEEAEEFLMPLASGEDTTFHRTEKDKDGNSTTVFGGEDSRNWAKKLLDENA